MRLESGAILFDRWMRFLIPADLLIICGVKTWISEYKRDVHQ